MQGHTRWVNIPRLRCGIVLRSEEEDACQIVAGGTITSVRYAPQFPARRRERVLPGHLVAITENDDTAVGEVERLYTAHDMWTAAFA
jgi:hypothetical protein